MNPVIRACLFAAVLLFSFPFLPTAHAAEPLADVEAVRLHADAGLNLIGKGRIAQGIRNLASAWPMPPAEIERLIEQAQSQAPVMASRFGAVLGHELIAEQRVGTSFVRRVYLQRFERHAIVWRIIYYRGADGWYVNNLNFSDETEDMFSDYGTRGLERGQGDRP